MSDKNKPAPTERRPCGAWYGSDLTQIWAADLGLIQAEAFLAPTMVWLWSLRCGHTARVSDRAVGYPTSTAAMLAAEDAAAEIARDILRALGRV